VIGVLWLIFSKRLPSDAALVRQFNRNLPAFLELSAMLATNSATDPTRDTTSVWSMEHYRKYQTLVRQARVIRVFESGSEVRFQVAGPSSAGKGYRVAVLWRAAEPADVIESIDNFRKQPGGPDHAYRPLGNGWFLWIGK
jgi:hypothetical protein